MLHFKITLVIVQILYRKTNDSLPVALCGVVGARYCLGVLNPEVCAKLLLEELLERQSSPCNARL